MVIRSLVLTFLSLAFVISARADLQLSPKVVTYELDGVKFKQLSFSDGGSQSITYAPPDGWDYFGSPTRLTLRPRNNPDVEGTISRTKLSEPAPIDEETARKLVDEVVASVPKGSVDIELLSQEMNPIVINGKETFLVTLSYTAFGRKFGRSLMFFNRDREQIRFQLVSPWVNFSQMQRAFFASQFSWQNL